MSAQRPPTGAPVAVDLVTPDLEQARSFYGPLLGWSFAQDDASPGVECRIDGQVAATLLPPSEVPVAGWRASFAGAQPASTAERVREAGGRVLAEGDEGGLTVVHVSDPGGATFAVVHGAAREAPEPGPGRAVWRELMTIDAAQAEAFYAAVLGYEVLQPPGAPEEYALFTLDGRPVAGRLVPAPELFSVLGSMWMVYFATTDTDESAARTEQLGGKVVAPPRDTPTGRLAAVTDPSGALFTLLRPAA